MRLHVWPIRSWQKAGVDFQVYSDATDGLPSAVGLPLTMRSIPPEEVYRDEGPTFALRNDQVQELMDRLWDLGFRPSEGTGSAGALRQAEAHLGNLRDAYDGMKSIASHLVQVVEIMSGEQRA